MKLEALEQDGETDDEALDHLLVQPGMLRRFTTLEMTDRMSARRWC